jgi:hypothetical protein
MSLHTNNTSLLLAFNTNNIISFITSHWVRVILHTHTLACTHTQPHATHIATLPLHTAYTGTHTHTGHTHTHVYHTHSIHWSLYITHSTYCWRTAIKVILHIAIVTHSHTLLRVSWLVLLHTHTHTATHHQHTHTQFHGSQSGFRMGSAPRLSLLSSPLLAAPSIHLPIPEPIMTGAKARNINARQHACCANRYVAPVLRYRLHSEDGNAAKSAQPARLRAPHTFCSFRSSSLLCLHFYSSLSLFSRLICIDKDTD